MTHVDITDAPDRTQVTRFRVREDGVVWTSDGETVSVLAWGEHSVRVRAAVMSDIADTDWALLSPAPAGDIDIDIDSDGNRATLDNGRIRVVLENTTQFDLQVGYETSRCQLSFFTSRGELLFRELDAGGSLKLRARNLQPHLGGDFRLTAAFEAAPDEHLPGMGQYQQDIVDRADIEAAARELLTQVLADVASEGRPVVGVGLKVRYAPFLTKTFVHKIATTFDRETVIAETMRLVDRIEPGRPLRLLGVRAEMQMPDDAREGHTPTRGGW